MLPGWRGKTDLGALRRLLLSIGRSSIRSQLVSICYFWNILAFIWRKVTGECSVPAESLLVIRVTVYCRNNNCLHTLLCLLKASILVWISYEKWCTPPLHIYTPPENPRHYTNVRVVNTHTEPPWRREWQPTPVFLLRAFHRQKSVVASIPWGCKESDRTEWLTVLLSKEH